MKSLMLWEMFKSCKLVIDYQSKKILHKNQKPDAKLCKCKTNKSCPLNGKCCTNLIVYKTSPKLN